ncbi:MAG: permease-like cell division protein FtsX [Erysipelotrichaceae bacterium]|nr:permease-like cell division protein FtsX [Erysipelotrichaceae bacterium]MBQ1533345.1 permease-like cell division protein FtsX [Erysipelotrichaceae bacterium]
MKRHFAMAVSSASAVTITLLLVGFFAAFAINMAYLTQEIEQSISLVCLIDYDVTDSSRIASMKGEIEQMESVDRVIYRTKDEEFDFYNQEYPEMAEFSELYREDNPFHDTFIVYMADGSSMSAVKDRITKMNGISSVQDGGSETYTLIHILHTTRNAGAILILALVALAIYLIYNTIKITIATRKDEIWIMRNVGARNGYIRAPFLVEGIIIGIFGSILPIGVIVYAYYWLYQATGGVLAGVITLIPVYPFILYLGGALLIIGIFVGFIGSYISVCKYLRLTR